MTTTTTPHDTTRERWLLDALALMRPVFAGLDIQLPEKIRVSCSWPRGGKRTAIGQAWQSKASSDGTTEIMVSPSIAEKRQVLATLVHELVHAHQDATGQDMDHGAGFGKTMRKVGLTGKPSKSVAAEGGAWETLWAGIEDALSDYPHAPITPDDGEKKQATRMIKCSCEACGYVARTTQQWIDEPGPPICPCNHQPMTVENKEPQP